MFHELRSILKQSLQQKGIQQAVEAAQVTQIFRDIIKERLGTKAYQTLRQVSWRDNILRVSAGSPQLASELRLRQLEILQELETRLPKGNYRLEIFG